MPSALESEPRMHREISHADRNFQPESRLFLYVFTAVIGVLLAADLLFPTDLWRSFAEWTSDNGVPLPKSNLLFGFQLALYASIVGGARILYGSLDSLSGANTHPPRLCGQQRPEQHPDQPQQPNRAHNPAAPGA